MTGRTAMPTVWVFNRVLLAGSQTTARLEPVTLLMSRTWVIADDTDTRIEYFGGSNVTTPQDLLDAGVTLSAPGRKIFGFNNTLHGINTSFSFRFNGSSPAILVYASVYNDAEFSIKCLLDGATATANAIHWSSHPNLPLAPYEAIG
ncbi:hypothetical protein D9758_017011 [Tetrapyrgos nigripes]|uniref:Uncharacterized protein n=1 Tax=Tetrapyrgos nigripes TaxID=182062 RepID=A0A8H5C1H0_9AGAR|nr:hypothetical protein D9758_017011 [Tetrapyrgos nigripes]